MTGVIEIRSYELKANAQAAFETLFIEEVTPLLAAWGHRIVFAGRSLHGDDSFVLIRAYDSEDHRRASQDSFYASDEWRSGPREALLSMIDRFTSSVLPIADEALALWQAELSEASNANGRR
ncbi:NIPSNAP family protein [Sphingomonas sp. MS122]|uniref:NIPSNAP family protein n=1 Tax=Sphingomonas sp. MS122 TaxID=3412683 RepID=UPI003C2EE1F1